MSKIPHKISKVVCLGRRLFALKVVNESTIMILKIDFRLEDGYSLTVGTQEFEGEIVEINGDKKMLYSLVEIEGNMNLKIFNYRKDRFQFLNQIENI